MIWGGLFLMISGSLYKPYLSLIDLSLIEALYKPKKADISLVYALYALSHVSLISALY